MPHFRPLLLLLCALALNACRDPEAEAALLATLDAPDDAADAQVDIADMAASEIDVQPDLADSLQADTSDGFELPDTQDAEVDAKSDLPDVTWTEVDADFELPNSSDAEVDGGFELPNGFDAEVDADFELPNAADAEVDAVLDVLDATADGSDAQMDVADVDLCAGVACTDKLPCQIGTCAGSTGTCSYVNAPGTATCSDGNACTIGDACSGGTCLPGSVTTCDDSNSCTSDFCVLATGCTSTIVTDNTSCGDGPVCLMGVCTLKGCGDGVCNGIETISLCATDCAFLAGHYAGTCTVPGSQDTCAIGYVCAERGGGSDICVADFDTWPTLPLAHTASDFTSPSANIVSDTRTGLMWGKVTQASEPWSSAPNACNQLIDGLMDWHLPTVAELASLIDFTTTSPSASAPGMDFTKGLVFWTTTPVGTGGGKWWEVNFQDGELQSANGANANTVACVRTTAPLSVTGIGTRFASQDGGATVLDRISGLHWQHDVGGANLDWPSAKAYCATLGTGWRMPTIVELRSIIDRSGTNPTLDNAFAKPPYGNYWSTPDSGGSAWQVDFYTGNSNGQLKNNLFAVRCVR